MSKRLIYTQDKVYYYGNTFKLNKLCKKLRLTFEFAYSKKGPSDCLGCNSYFLYGFIYMQDMLEKGKKLYYHKCLIQITLYLLNKPST